MAANLRHVSGESRSSHVGSEGPESATFRPQLVAILLLTNIFLLNFMSRIVYAPLLPNIEKDLAVGHGEAGSLFLMVSLGYFTSVLASGFVTSRLTHRTTIIVSALAVGLALIGVSFGSKLWSIRLGVLVVGLAAGAYLPSGISTLTSLIDSRHWGKAIAIHELAPNLSFVAAPLICEALLILFSWRHILVLLGLTSVLTGIAFARFGRGGNFTGETPGFGPLKTLLVNPAFWIMTMLFSFGISSSLGIYTMLPLYLVNEHGMERNMANTLIAISRISGLGMTFVAGWITDRLGPKRTLLWVFLFSGAATLLLGLVHGHGIIWLVFLQPMLAVCFFPAGFAAVSSIGPRRLKNLAVSFTVPFAFFLGGGAVPAAIGFLGDEGLFRLGFALVGGIILVGSLLSLRLRFYEEDRPGE